MKSRVASFLMAFLILLSVSACKGESLDSSSVPTEPEDMGVPASSIFADDSLLENDNRLSSDDPIYYAITTIEQAMHESYDPDNISFTISGDETRITISAWFDSVSYGANLALQEGGMWMDEWDDLVSHMKNYCTGIKEKVSKWGFSDTSIVVNILNDLDHEKILLSILDGEVIYDCTK